MKLAGQNGPQSAESQIRAIFLSNSNSQVVVACLDRQVWAMSLLFGVFLFSQSNLKLEL